MSTSDANELSESYRQGWEAGRAATIEECAKIADKHVDHRSSGTVCASHIVQEFRALSGTPEDATNG